MVLLTLKLKKIDYAFLNDFEFFLRTERFQNLFGQWLDR